MCTATTDPTTVRNASIVVNGGIVEATGTGRAIHITGAQGNVNIISGQVLARNGFAIETVSNFPDNGITMSGGFVFAWNAPATPIGDIYGSTGSIANVISHNRLNQTGGTIVAWHTNTGTGTYTQRTNDHLTVVSHNNTATAHWEVRPNNPIFPLFQDGIEVTNAGLPHNFFSLNVNVVQQFFTLTTKMHMDGVEVDGSVQRRTVRAGTMESIATRPENPVVFMDVPPDQRPIINGDKFLGWRIENNGGTILDANSINTQFLMPGNDVTIIADYGRRHRLQMQAGYIISPINFGTSTNLGYYAVGEEVSIRIDSAFGTYFFQYWLLSLPPYGNFTTDTSYFASTVHTVTTFRMPPPPNLDHHVGINALIDTPIFTPAGPYTTTAEHGWITRYYLTDQPVNRDTLEAYAGTGIRIEPRPHSPYDDPDRYVFSHWSNYPAQAGWFLDPLNVGNNRFITPGRDVTITANYVPIYTLEIENNLGETIRTESGRKEGDKVLISAPPLEPYHRFTHWFFEQGTNSDFNDSNPNAQTTILTIPNPLTGVPPGSTITVVAHYEPIQFNVVAHGGIEPGPGSTPTPFNVGDRVPVNAAPPAEGMMFDRWVVAEGNISYEPTAEALRQRPLTFTMPPHNVQLIATYTEWVDPPPGGGVRPAVAAAHDIPQTGDLGRANTYIALLIGAAGLITTTLYFGIFKKRNM